MVYDTPAGPGWVPPPGGCPIFDGEAFVASIFGMVGGLVGLALLAYALIVFNGLIQMKFMVEKAWANIDVLLKQRHDEVPNLVACVQGAAGFEKGVLENVTKARAESQASRGIRERAKAEAGLSVAVDRLLVTAENYPALTATENFLALQKRLSALENDLADRREFYNDSVANYNTRLQQFPDLLLARAFKFAPKEMFRVAEEDKQLIQVRFGAA